MSIYDLELEDRFGIMSGKDCIVFVKTGRGETIYGSYNRYVSIAYEIRECSGYALIISANPLDENCSLESEINTVLNMEHFPSDIIFIGYSYGALIGAWQGYQSKSIRAMLLINGPLMINWHRTKVGIERFEGNVHLVYGSEDPSAPYVEILNYIESPRCSYEIMEGIDHNFSGRTGELIRIISDFISCKRE